MRSRSHVLELRLLAATAPLGHPLRRLVRRLGRWNRRQPLLCRSLRHLLRFSLPSSLLFSLSHVSVLPISSIFRDHLFLRVHIILQQYLRCFLLFLVAFQLLDEPLLERLHLPDHLLTVLDVLAGERVGFNATACGSLASMVAERVVEGVGAFARLRPPRRRGPHRTLLGMSPCLRSFLPTRTRRLSVLVRDLGGPAPRSAHRVVTCRFDRGLGLRLLESPGRLAHARRLLRHGSSPLMGCLLAGVRDVCDSLRHSRSRPVLLDLTG